MENNGRDGKLRDKQEREEKGREGKGREDLGLGVYGQVVCLHCLSSLTAGMSQRTAELRHYMLVTFLSRFAWR
jgi:hypothetical protein